MCSRRIKCPDEERRKGGGRADEKARTKCQEDEHREGKAFNDNSTGHYLELTLLFSQVLELGTIIYR